jgi:hypothetical protein
MNELEPSDYPKIIIPSGKPWYLTLPGFVLVILCICETILILGILHFRMGLL